MNEQKGNVQSIYLTSIQDEEASKTPDTFSSKENRTGKFPPPKTTITIERGPNVARGHRKKLKSIQEERDETKKRGRPSRESSDGRLSSIAILIQDMNSGASASEPSKASQMPSSSSTPAAPSLRQDEEAAEQTEPVFP